MPAVNTRPLDLAALLALAAPGLTPEERRRRAASLAPSPSPSSVAPVSVAPRAAAPAFGGLVPGGQSGFADIAPNPDLTPPALAPAGVDPAAYGGALPPDVTGTPGGGMTLEDLARMAQAPRARRVPPSLPARVARDYSPPSPPQYREPGDDSDALAALLEESRRRTATGSLIAAAVGGLFGGVDGAGAALRGFQQGAGQATDQDVALFERRSRGRFQRSRDKYAADVRGWQARAAQVDDQRAADDAANRDSLARYDKEFEAYKQGVNEDAAAEKEAREADADRAKQRNDFYARLTDAAPATRQQLLTDAERDGTLRRLGITIPKNGDAFDVAGIETATAAATRERDERAGREKEAQRNAAWQQSAARFAKDLTPADQQKYWAWLDASGQAKQHGLALSRDAKTGRYDVPTFTTEAAALGRERLDETKRHNRAQEARQRAQDAAAAQARAAKARGDENGVRDWTGLSEALGVRATAEKEIARLKGLPDTEENRAAIRQQRARAGAAQGKISAIRAKNPAVSTSLDKYLGANKDVIHGGSYHFTNGSDEGLPAPVRSVLRNLDNIYVATYAHPTDVPTVDPKTGRTTFRLMQAYMVGQPEGDEETDANDPTGERWAGAKSRAKGGPKRVPLVTQDLIDDLREAGATVQGEEPPPLMPGESKEDRPYRPVTYRVTFPAGYGKAAPAALAAPARPSGAPGRPTPRFEKRNASSASATSAAPSGGSRTVTVGGKSFGVRFVPAGSR